MDWADRTSPNGHSILPVHFRSCGPGKSDPDPTRFDSTESLNCIGSHHTATAPPCTSDQRALRVRHLQPRACASRARAPRARLALSASALLRHLPDSTAHDSQSQAFALSHRFPSPPSFSLINGSSSLHCSFLFPGVKEGGTLAPSPLGKPHPRPHRRVPCTVPHPFLPV